MQNSITTDASGRVQILFKRLQNAPIHIQQRHVLAGILSHVGGHKLLSRTPLVPISEWRQGVLEACIMKAGRRPGKQPVVTNKLKVS